MKEMRKPTIISLISVCAAFSIICDTLVVPPFLPYSGVWYSWIFMSEPITGILLGPWTGFFSNLIGVMIGHLINYVDAYEFLFTLGAPLGAMISAWVFKRKWSLALTYYIALLGGFFAAPVSWQIPFWGLWDTYLAFIVLLFLAIITTRRSHLWDTKSPRRLVYITASSAFIGLEADVLFRVFIFVPCQTYNLFYGFNISELQAIWALGAVETPVKVGLSVLFTAVVGPPIINAIRKMRFSI